MSGKAPKYIHVGQKDSESTRLPIDCPWYAAASNPESSQRRTKSSQICSGTLSVIVAVGPAVHCRRNDQTRFVKSPERAAFTTPWVEKHTIWRKTALHSPCRQPLLQVGCCFFPLRKCIFSVAATFWVAKLDFLCCWFFSCLGQFFSCLGRVFSRLGRFFPAASKMHFFCCKGAFVLLQGVFSAALNFSRCEAAFFAGVFSRCGNSFFPLQGVFFLLPNVFFSVPMFFSCCEPVFFARCAKTRS